MISKELLDILCCPETKADLILDGNTLVSTDKNTRRRYRIEDDIPVMLIDESEQLSMDEWQRNNETSRENRSWLVVSCIFSHSVCRFNLITISPNS